MRARSFVLAAAAAASVALTAAPTASACEEVRVNGVGGAVVCADTALNLNGTTVAPSATVGACPWLLDPSMWTCTAPRTVSVGTTGVVLGTTPSPVVTIKPLTVSSADTTVATIYVNGRAIPVTVPGFCVGPSTYC